MLMYILIGVVVLIVGILALAAMRPDEFRMERSTTINASPDRIYPNINDFRLWSGWSPWEKLDPSLKRTFSGATAGVGAAYAWVGNNKVGSGRMEIMDSTPSSRVVIKLDFLKPFEAHNTADFTIVANGATTTVKWAMFGQSPFMSKVMGLFVNMDQLIGRDFEKGLASLKAIAEST